MNILYKFIVSLELKFSLNSLIRVSPDGKCMTVMKHKILELLIENKLKICAFGNLHYEIFVFKK